MKWLAKITGGYSSSARLVDGMLVISLPDAMSPVVWRMDLAPVRASALEVRSKSDGTHTLVLKNVKGEASEIAPFDDRAKAVRALMVISAALENGITSAPAAAPANNFEAPAAPVYAAAPQKSGGNTAAGIIGAVLLIALIAGLLSMGPRSAALPSGGASSTAQGGDASAPGAPVSADEFLRNR
jgi:hypothetical protein